MKKIIFTLFVLLQFAMADREACREAIDYEADLKIIDYNQKVDTQILEREEIINQMERSIDTYEATSGMSQAKAHRNYLASRGALDPTLAQYMNNQDDIRLNHMKSKARQEVANAKAELSQFKIEAQALKDEYKLKVLKDAADKKRACK